MVARFKSTIPWNDNDRLSFLITPVLDMNPHQGIRDKRSQIIYNLNSKDLTVQLELLGHDVSAADSQRWKRELFLKEVNQVVLEPESEDNYPVQAEDNYPDDHVEHGETLLRPNTPPTTKVPFVTPCVDETLWSVDIRSKWSSVGVDVNGKQSIYDTTIQGDMDKVCQIRAIFGKKVLKWCPRADVIRNSPSAKRMLLGKSDILKRKDASSSEGSSRKKCMLSPSQVDEKYKGFCSKKKASFSQVAEKCDEIVIIKKCCKVWCSTFCKNKQ